MIKKEVAVLDYLKANEGFHAPRTINIALGYSPRGSWMSAMLKALVAEGKVERNARGHYRLAVAKPVEEAPLNLANVQRPSSVA